MKLEDEIESMYAGMEDAADAFLEAHSQKEDTKEEVFDADNRKGFVSGGVHYTADGLPDVRHDEYSSEQLRTMFGEYAEAMKGDDKPARDNAMIMSWVLMRRMVDDIIYRTFTSYINAFPKNADGRQARKDFIEELESTGRDAIYRSLPRYDKRLADPSTFFWTEVSGDLKAYMTKYYHQVNTYKPRQLAELEKVENAFAALGKTPSLKDYEIMTNMPVRTIQDLLASRLKRQGDLSLEQTYENSEMMDRPSASRTDEEAISNVVMERLQSAMKETLTADEHTCFQMYAEDMTPSMISIVAGYNDLSRVKDLIEAARTKLMRHPTIRSFMHHNQRTASNSVVYIGFDACGSAEATERNESFLDDFFFGPADQSAGKLKIASVYTAASPE